MLKKIIVLLVTFLILSCSKKEAAKPASAYRKIPVEDFCQPLPTYSFKLSPDGAFIAQTKPYNNKMNLFVLEVGKDSLMQLTYNKNNNITDFQWINANLLAFTLDFNGDGFHELYAMQPDRGGFKKLSDVDNADYRLTNLKTHDEKEIFVEISDANLQIYTLNKLNIDSRKAQIIAENNGSLLSYISDQKGKILIASFYDAQGSGILYRSAEDQPFKILVRNSFSEVISPLGFAENSNNLLVTSNKGRDKAAVYELDVNNGNLGKILLQDSDADIFEVIEDGKGELVGALIEKDSVDIQYWNQSAKKLQAEVSSLFGGKTVKIKEQSDDGQKALLEVSNGSHPGEFYFYDLNSKKTLLVLNTAGWLKNEELAPIKTTVINSTDGFKLYTYLTEPQKPNGAAVILIHGGPWARDSKKFNSDAQFLANRGYLVVQTNYRGSLGYGRKFLESGYKEWGRGMINDLSSVAGWLKTERKIDKIGVMGTSFGGYAALRSLQLFPDLYKCAVTQSALIDMVYDRKNTFYGESDPANQLIGHPVKDYNLLRDFSPFYNHKYIKSPVLLVYGINDQTVNLKQVDSLVFNLQKQGVSTEYYKKNDDAHGLYNPKNLIDYYNLLEKFLKTNLLGEK